MLNMPTVKPIPFPEGKGYFKTLLSYIRWWEVVEDYKVTIPGIVPIVIPRGFIFDGASIPKLFWNLMSPTGILLIPGIIHDYAYRYHGLIIEEHGVQSYRYMSKGEADALFLEIADYANGLPILNKIAYLAVKWYGIGSWSK